MRWRETGKGKGPERRDEGGAPDSITLAKSL